MTHHRYVDSHPTNRGIIIFAIIAALLVSLGLVYAYLAPSDTSRVGMSQPAVPATGNAKQPMRPAPQQ